MSSRTGGGKFFPNCPRATVVVSPFRKELLQVYVDSLCAVLLHIIIHDPDASISTYPVFLSARLLRKFALRNAYFPDAF